MARCRPQRDVRRQVDQVLVLGSTVITATFELPPNPVGADAVRDGGRQPGVSSYPVRCEVRAVRRRASSSSGACSTWPSSARSDGKSAMVPDSSRMAPETAMPKTP